MKAEFIDVLNGYDKIMEAYWDLTAPNTLTENDITMVHRNLLKLTWAWIEYCGWGMREFDTAWDKHYGYDDDDDFAPIVGIPQKNGKKIGSRRA